MDNKRPLLIAASGFALLASAVALGAFAKRQPVAPKPKAPEPVEPPKATKPKAIRKSPNGKLPEPSRN